MNPYQILQISPGSDLDQIKNAYKKLARVYHPTKKGGSKEQFLKLQQAYQQAVKQFKKGSGASEGEMSNNGIFSDHQSLRTGFDQFLQRQQQRPDPRGTQGFSGDRFNQQFQEQRGSDDMVYPVSSNDYRERTKQDFEHENAMIDQDRANVQRLFERGQFDANTFNRVFNHVKKSQETQIEEYREPEPTPLGVSMAFTDVNESSGLDTRNLTQLGYSDYGADGLRNPRSVDPRVLAKFRGKKDITRESPMDQGQVKQRLSAYQQFDPKIQIKPDQGGPSYLSQAVYQSPQTLPNHLPSHQDRSHMNQQRPVSSLPSQSLPLPGAETPT